jgi:hypothetical protein
MAGRDLRGGLCPSTPLCARSRGDGKSTLLRKIESQTWATKGVAVFVDVETLRNRPYPDILLETLIELLTGIRDRLEPDAFYRLDQRIARARVRRRLLKLTATLQRLLARPQVARHTISELQIQASRASVHGGLRLRNRALHSEMNTDARRSETSAESSKASEERTKMDVC